MKRNKIYTVPNGGFRIPHNKHLGNKHEEWIVPKKQQNRTIMESIIKWQTGEPKESGEHFVTLLNGKVRLAEFYKYKVADKEYWGCIPCGIVGVKAWCKLSDIEPYKEETNDTTKIDKKK